MLAMARNATGALLSLDYDDISPQLAPQLERTRKTRRTPADDQDIHA
jgi:hypothetical protein